MRRAECDFQCEPVWLSTGMQELACHLTDYCELCCVSNDRNCCIRLFGHERSQLVAVFAATILTLAARTLNDSFQIESCFVLQSSNLSTCTSLMSMSFSVQKCIDARIQSGAPRDDDLTDELLVDLLEEYLRLTVLLHQPVSAMFIQVVVCMFLVGFLAAPAAW